MGDDGLEIRSLSTPEELAAVIRVFQQVWGAAEPVATVELLRAISHSGGYVAGAFERDHLVGASFGFLARHEGEPALHSHITGILPGVQHSGVGRAMKFHQRDWAHRNGLTWVTWTFDPLVRRNAWFNLEVLGAAVAEYLVDFYGPMTDALNRNDETDRLLVAWPTSTSLDDHGDEPGPDAVTESLPLVRVDTPVDIVVLRRTDPATAAGWRQRVRTELGERMASGGQVIGFTRDGEYLVRGVV